MGAVSFDLGLSPPSPALRLCPTHHRYPHSSLRRFYFIVSARTSRNEEPTGRHDFSLLSGRRDVLLPLTAGTISSLLRWNLLGLGLGLGLETPSLAEESSSAPNFSVTEKVYLEITKCPSISITSRENGVIPTVTEGVISALPTYTVASSSLLSTLATSSTLIFSASRAASSTSQLPSSSIYCGDGELLGRIVIGLYGKQVPETVANFKAMCTGEGGSSYKGSLIHRILEGQYIMAGKQGYSKEKGEVIPPSKLSRNMESINSEAFKIPHLRPGMVSLCLSENDDEDQFKLDPDYRNVEFLITTGPGPAPQLDNKNIVFGIVLEGLDVVRAAASVPTYKPGERIRQFNELASFLGDERASNARSIWNRPLKALYISDCGVL